MSFRDPFTRHVAGIAQYAVAQFKEKFEKLDIVTRQIMFERGNSLIYERQSNIAGVPGHERHKLLNLSSHWNWQLYSPNGDREPDLCCIDSGRDRDRYIRDRTIWWRNLAHNCTSITLMEVIRLTFHDIVIPSEIVEDVEVGDSNTIRLSPVADEHATIVNTVATNPCSAATTLGIR